MNTRHKTRIGIEPGPPTPIPPDPGDPPPPIPEPLPEPDEPERSRARARLARFERGRWIPRRQSVSIVGGLVRMRRPTTS